MLSVRTTRAEHQHDMCGVSTHRLKTHIKNMRVYQNRHILSFKFLKLNLSTKGSTVFIKIVDCFSKKVDPSVKKGWPFHQKGLTFSSKRVDLSVKKGWPFRQKELTFPSKRVDLSVKKSWPFRQKGLTFLSTKRICLFWHTPILDYINDSNLFLIKLAHETHFLHKQTGTFIIRPLEYRGAVTPIILVSSVCFTDALRRI